MIDLNSEYLSANNKYPKTMVTFKDLKNLIQTYQNKILITQRDRESTVINISILEEDQLKGVMF